MTSTEITKDFMFFNTRELGTSSTLDAPYSFPVERRLLFPDDAIFGTAIPTNPIPLEDVFNHPFLSKLGDNTLIAD